MAASMGLGDGGLQSNTDWEKGAEPHLGFPGLGLSLIWAGSGEGGRPAWSSIPAVGGLGLSSLSWDIQPR